MLTSPLAPYLHWAKTRPAAEIDLAGSNLLACSLDDLPGAREALALTLKNDDGYVPLREAIGAHYGVDMSRVVLGSGCAGANFVAIAALVGAGDDVLMERPGYDQLIGSCRLIGANVRRFERRADRGFAIDAEDVRRAMTPRTRLIIVSTPHNPSGAALDRPTLTALGDIAAGHGAHVLVDEVYLDALHIAGAGTASDRALAARHSAACLDGPFIATSSLTKSYGLAGLRSGWAIAPAAVAARLHRVRDVVDGSNSAPADSLATLAFRRLPELAARTASLLATNLTIAREWLAGQPRLELAVPAAATIVFPSIAGVTDAAPFVDRAMRDAAVALAPGHFFEAPAHFRISLAGRTEALAQGLARVGRLLDASAS